MSSVISMLCTRLMFRHRLCACGCPSGGRGTVLQVLEVAARQLVVGNDLNLAVTLLGDLDLVAKVADATLDLDLLVQELLEGRDIEDLVGGRLGGVDDELEKEKAPKSAMAIRPGNGETEKLGRV